MEARADSMRAGDCWTKPQVDWLRILGGPFAEETFRGVQVATDYPPAQGAIMCRRACVPSEGLKD